MPPDSRSAPVIRPDKEDLRAARKKTIPDVIGPGLTVLFCGINPGLYSAAIGRHFGRPGNRFWKALHAAGFTPRQFSPYEGRTLLAFGYGITDIVDRATASADELSTEELKAGKRKLVRKVMRCRPQALAVLGLGAYRTAFGRPGAQLGLQQETIGPTRIWVLPSPSGLNAGYPLKVLVRYLKALRASLA